MKQVIKITEQDLKNIIRESVESFITESFKHYNSQKVADAIKMFGMPKYCDVHGHYMLTKLNDNDVIGISETPSSIKGQSSFKLGDGKHYIVYDSLSNDYARKYNYSSVHSDDVQHMPSREIHKGNEFADSRAFNNIDSDYYSRQHYRPMTSRGEDARSLRRNPYFTSRNDRQYGTSNGWDRKSANNAMSNLRNGNDRFGNTNKYLY